MQKISVAKFVGQFLIYLIGWLVIGHIIFYFIPAWATLGHDILALLLLINIGLYAAVYKTLVEDNPGYLMALSIGSRIYRFVLVIVAALIYGWLVDNAFKKGGTGIVFVADMLIYCAIANVYEALTTLRMRKTAPADAQNPQTQKQ